ncbi:uncharacterized protein LOC116394761 [Anarrhichthys ocellatus]|uniref:uncharacterized protein LOC116394761 n=1 Tax=Anarrhichthys ocellatus TaxID=433405 RepID=UPI0012ED0CF1|nr:uncharacterized protein LOC116394761 [Anarrhichthys ocellatus]
MRVFLISFLLFGSVACFPMGKEYDANSAETSFMWQPLPLGNWFSGLGVSSDAGSSFPLLSLPNPSSNKATGHPAPQIGSFSAGPGSFSSNVFAGGSTSFKDGHHNSPEVGAYEVAYAGYGYDGSAPDGRLGSASVGDSWSSEPAGGYDAVEEIPEPIFSDVSDLEPVYSFSSRSRYQRGRAVFAQTRYNPGKPSRTSKQSGPAKAPTKGAF